MPFIYDAPFAQTPKSNAVDLTAAVAVGTAGTTLVTAGTNGCVVTSIRATAKGSLVAGAVNINKAGKPIRSESLASYTYSAAAKVPQVIFDVTNTLPIELASGETLDASLLVAQTAGVTVFATWKDY